MPALMANVLTAATQGEAIAVTPGAMLMLLLAAVFLGRAVSRASRGISGAQFVSAALGFAVLAVVELPPLSTASERSLTLHMLQHMTIIAIAAPLLALADPVRRSFWLGARSPDRGLRASSGTFAVAAWAAVLLALYAWHSPPLFEAAERHEALHALEHFSFFATSFLFWWVAFHRPPGGNHGLAFLLVFTGAIPMNILSALMVFSGSPWYEFAGPGPRTWGLSPIEDQQLAGVVMWVAGEVIYVLVAAVLFARWMAEADRPERAAIATTHGDAS